MADVNSNNLEDLFRRLDEGVKTDPSEPLDLTEKESLAQIRSLGATLRKSIAVQETHYTLPQIQELVRDRSTAQDGWDAPDHLTACSLCLEAFEVVLESLPEVPARNQRAVAALGPSQVSPIRLRLSAWRVPLAAAAAVALAGLLGLYLFSAATTVTIQDGSLVLASGEVIQPGSPMPQGTPLLARSDTHAKFPDGSVVRIAKDSHLSIDQPWSGGALIDLNLGAVTASVTKQKPGQQFHVHTPLSDVIVVGTRFSVTTNSENAPVFETYRNATGWMTQKIKVSAITVNVEEGVVVVKSKSDEVHVPAGHSAVVRDGQDKIDTSGE